MPFVVAAVGAMFFVKLYCGQVPVEDLKIDPVEISRSCDPCDLFQDSFADALPAIVSIDVEVFEKETLLAAKACKVRIEDRVGYDPLICFSDQAFDKRICAEHRIGKFFFGYYEVLVKLFKFCKFASKTDNGPNVVARRFPDGKGHKKAVPELYQARPS